jgi:hypothetical protein
LEPRIPGNLEPDKVPQMITITFNGAVNSDNLDLYQEIFADRLNPNGCQIKGMCAADILHFRDKYQL